MTDQSQDSGSTAANKGVKKGLPVTGLPAAEDAAQKLWGVARLGKTTHEAFARQFGPRAKASGSTWDTRIALLRGFKLIDTEANQIGLSELGQQLVNASSPEGQAAARRSAMTHLRAYRELIESFDGTQLPDIDVLATRLQFEYGKTEDIASKAAQAFVESLDHAGMRGQDGLVRLSVSASSEVLDSTIVEANEEEEEADAEQIDAAFAEEELPDETLPIDGAPAAREGSADVSVSVTLDLSSFSAEDVVKILGALRGGNATG